MSYPVRHSRSRSDPVELPSHQQKLNAQGVLSVRGQKDAELKHAVQLWRFSEGLCGRNVPRPRMHSVSTGNRDERQSLQYPSLAEQMLADRDTVRLIIRHSENLGKPLAPGRVREGFDNSLAYVVGCLFLGVLGYIFFFNPRY